MAEIAAAMADGEAIKAEITENEGRLLIITAEPESSEAIPETVEATEAAMEAEAQPEDNEPAKKPARKGKGKKDAAFTGDADK